MRSTTFTTRILRVGISARRIDTAASVSSVGTSPAQARITSGASPATSVPAQSKMPMPRVMCAIASSIESQSKLGCLPATTTFT